MKRLALIASAVGLASAAFAQTPLLRNSNMRTNFYGPAGVTGAWNGQAANTSWTTWPERGAEYTLASLSPISEVSVPFLVLGALAGGETIQVTIYNTDGAAVNSDLGNGPYNSPNSIVFQATLPVTRIDDQWVRVAVPNVTPTTQNVVVAVRMLGGNWNTGPFDPAANTNHAGFRFMGTPDRGSCPNSARNVNAAANHGRVWRRVFTPAASAWGCDETTAFPPFNPNFPAPIPYAMGCSIWSGTPTDWVNEFAANEDGFYRAYPETDQITGDVLTQTDATYCRLEGTNRKLTQIDAGFAGDTTQNPNATFTVSVHPVVIGVNGHEPGTAIWTSAPQSIPNGLDPLTANTFAATIPVPNVVCPDEVFVSMDFNFGSPTPAPGNCGPLVRLTTAGPPAVGQVGPEPGMSDFAAFWQKDLVSGTWGSFFYPPNLWDNVNGFQVEVNGWAAFALTLASAQTTLVPTGQAIVRGRADANNNIANLANDDGVANRYCKFIVTTDPSLFLQIRWTSTSANLSPSGMTCRVKSKMVHAGLFSQKIEAFNYTTNVYEENRTDSIALAYNTRDLVLTGTLSRYVRQSDGQVNMQVSVRQTGPSTSLFPCADFDLVNWIVQ